MQAPVLVCEQGPGGMAKDRLAESKGPGGERAGDWGVGACGQKLFPAPVPRHRCALQSSKASNYHRLLTDLIAISILLAKPFKICILVVSPSMR